MGQAANLSACPRVTPSTLFGDKQAIRGCSFELVFSAWWSVKHRRIVNILRAVSPPIRRCFLNLRSDSGSHSADLSMKCPHNRTLGTDTSIASCPPQPRPVQVASTGRNPAATGFHTLAGCRPGREVPERSRLRSVSHRADAAPEAIIRLRLVLSSSFPHTVACCSSRPSIV